MANAPSKLEAHRQFIADQRRRGTTYRRIAEMLAEKGIPATYSTIHAFVKVRSKPRRKTITMYEGEEHPARPALQEAATQITGDHRSASGPNTPALADQLDAIRRLKESKPTQRAAAKGLPSFREDAPLDRLSDEEAHQLRKKQ